MGNKGIQKNHVYGTILETTNMPRKYTCSEKQRQHEIEIKKERKRNSLNSCRLTSFWGTPSHYQTYADLRDKPKVKAKDLLMSFLSMCLFLGFSLSTESQT